MLFRSEQMAKTEAKKAELEADVSKLTNKIDRAASQSAARKGEVKALEADLAELAKTQAEMDSIRRETQANFDVAQAELTQGLTGVRKALGVLRDYYGGAAAFMQQPAAPQQHAAASGAGGSIINILEVCESDFANNLAKEESENADAASEYETTSQENKVTKTTLDQDVKYKTAEFKGLDAAIVELTSDKDTLNTEYSAVMDYYTELKDRCVAKPESYEDRKARREAEIEGLKQALQVLEDETAFVQRKRRGVRGAVEA